MIPVTVQLDGATFRALEQIADQRGTSMRHLIAEYLRAGLAPEPYSRVISTRSGKRITRCDVEAWIEAARLGVTNETIAQRAGVSRQLVSRCLIERGIRRQRPRAAADESEAA